MKLNELGLHRFESAAARSEELRIELHDDGVNVPVCDFGVRVPGSLGAGVALAEISAAGMATVTIEPGKAAIYPGPDVSFRSDRPVAACLAAQYAGWKIDQDGYFAMGSGPMRALAGKEELYEKIGYREAYHAGIGVLESSELPSPEVCQRLADDCDIEARKLMVLVAPTASLAGTVQVVARTVETALHKLLEIGFDVSTVVCGWGVAPLPPVAANDLAGIGRTNDAVIYGGRVQLWVETADDILTETIAKVPSNSSATYGRTFAKIFDAHDRDFYKIDPLLFSPAWIRINNLKTGRSFQAGEINSQVIIESFEG